MKGTFEALISDHTLAMSKNNTPSVKFKLTATKNLLTDTEIQPEAVFFDAYLSDAAFDNSMKALSDSIGWYGTDFSDFNGTGMFLGMKVSIVCDEEIYEGKLQTKVKFMNNINRIPKLTPMGSGEARNFAESLRGRALKFRQNHKPANTGSQAGDPSFKGQF